LVVGAEVDLVVLAVAEEEVGVRAEVGKS